MGGLVEPYRRRPESPRVAMLTSSGEVIDESGDSLSLDDLPDGVRVWGSYDTVHSLVNAGAGEALCWNGEPIRWRHRRFESGWKRRPSDVNVIKLPFPESDELAVAGIAGWRDWLRSFGAAATGTTGGAAWSLLRATIVGPLWLGVGTRPPIKQTLGGRQELGPAGAGRIDGDLELVDLPAAYARELGNLPYGGRWYHADELAPIVRPPEWWAQQNRAVFVRARVSIPSGLALGPLPRRSTQRLRGMAAFLLGAEYPSSGRIQGVWTWRELEAAQEAGCRLLRVLDTWVHVAPSQPFLPWWSAVLRGREAPGLAGQLAKVTGNALWGRFCMDARTAGERTIRSRQGRQMVNRPLPFPGGLPPTHDLAETVSGRVRAELFRVMHAAGPELVSAHTDGAWLRRERAAQPPAKGAGRRELVPAIESVVDAAIAAGGWRVKESARRIDVLNPQGLRYWPRPTRRNGQPVVVMAGVPSELAPDAFAAAWERAGFEP